MRTRVLAILAVAIVGVAALACPSVAVRSVKCVVTVRDAKEGPVANVVVMIEAAPNLVFAAKTDAQGVATAQLELPSSDVALYLRLMEGSDLIDDGQPFVLRESYLAAITHSHFKPWYTVPVASDQTEAVATIQGEECVSVAVLTPDVMPRERIVVTCATSSAQLLSGRLAETAVRGVKKSAPAILVASTIGQAAVKVIELSGTQTGSDLQLIDVVVPEDGSEAVRITVTDRARMVRRPSVRMPAVTLISMDASKVSCAHVQPSGLVAIVGEVVPKLDAGRYAVVPGLLNSSSGVCAVYGYIKQNGVAPAGIPCIDVVAGGPNGFEIQAVPALDAALALPAYPK